MIKIYKKLTEEQKNRGVVFTSTLSVSKEELAGDLTHEVMDNDKDKNETITRLKDDRFFNGSKWKYNIIRN
jgi:hypothetical protein